MRLYSLTGATAVDAPEGHFAAAEDGAFDLPDAVSSRLHPIAVAGKRQWETDIERQHRLIAEETARRQDPATLLAAVEKIVGASERPAAGGQSAEIDALKAQVAALTEAVAAARAKPARKAPAARA